MLNQEAIQAIAQLWAKTPLPGSTGFHPLLLHLLDVAACTDAILQREPEPTRTRLGAALGLPWQEARPSLLLVAATHDLGKASPRFQRKWPEAEAWLREANLLPPGSAGRFRHGLATQAALADLLLDHGWPERLADQTSEAVGCHHGQRMDPESLGLLDGCRSTSEMGQRWRKLRAQLFGILLDTFKPMVLPTKEGLHGAEFMQIAGLVSIADWIGSNTTWFTYGSREDCLEPKAWFSQRRALADQALDALGWGSHRPLLERPREFQEIFPDFMPRPLQTAVADAVRTMDQPGILLVEAPMGEGKTEAAFYAHLELQRRHRHRGLYLALPTKATGNAMFQRTKTFLRTMRCERPLDLQLLHGAAQLNQDFQELRLAGIHQDEESGSTGRVLAAEWFTPRKRAILSEYGVGTVDQALITILPVRHQFVRLWGLANRVVVFDEVHAYDAYTGTLLHHLLDWLTALGSSIILLSATLPPSFRRELARRHGTSLPDEEPPYPRLTILQPGSLRQVAIPSNPARNRKLRLVPISQDLPGIKEELVRRLDRGGSALALVNTVQRAQDLYRMFGKGHPIQAQGTTLGRRMEDGLEVFLFHARYPANLRQVREDHALAAFGPRSTQEGRRILIATQVAEQSLDLDFDVLLSDLAPVDLLLQRAGRLWRHDREVRPVPGPSLLVAGLDGPEPPDFGAPLWWNKVYREDLLLRTWLLLHHRAWIELPGDIDPLVRDVYEDAVPVPQEIQERMARALIEGEGLEAGFRSFADQAVIERENWEMARLLKDDEDDPSHHPSLAAHTRLGEPSMTIVPILASRDIHSIPGFEEARALAMTALTVSRRKLVERLGALGVPESWQQSPILRQSYPLRLDATSHWTEDARIHLDDELGLCFDA